MELCWVVPVLGVLHVKVIELVDKQLLAAMPANKPCWDRLHRRLNLSCLFCLLVFNNEDLALKGSLHRLRLHHTKIHGGMDLKKWKLKSHWDELFSPHLSPPT